MGFVICNEDFSELGIYLASMSSMHPVQWGREDNSNWLMSLTQLSVCKSGCSEYHPYTKGRTFLIQGLSDNMMMSPYFVFQRITHCSQSSV